MNKDRFILKDNAEIELETGARLSSIGALFQDKTTMAAAWDKLTADNLSLVRIRNGDGLTVGNYTDLTLVSETSIVCSGGGILTNFCLREKTDIEKRLSAVEEGQGMQNGAIDDLGAITSALAEAQEGGTQ